MEQEERKYEEVKYILAYSNTSSLLTHLTTFNTIPFMVTYILFFIPFYFLFFKSYFYYIYLAVHTLFLNYA